MIQIYRLHSAARVAAIADADSACMVLRSGSVRLGLHMSADTASAIANELVLVLPAMSPATRRPQPPSREGKPQNWAAIVCRIRDGRPLPSDAAAISQLLSYLGVTVP